MDKKFLCGGVKLNSYSRCACSGWAKEVLVMSAVVVFTLTQVNCVGVVGRGGSGYSYCWTLWFVCVVWKLQTSGWPNYRVYNSWLSEMGLVSPPDSAMLVVKENVKMTSHTSNCRQMTSSFFIYKPLNSSKVVQTNGEHYESVLVFFSLG